MRLYDVHSRFAQLHLRTPAERAVYFTLVAQFAESWSAVEIANLKGLDVEPVEAVLDRYADAGVVDVVDSETGLRYRWCSDMSYLSRARSSEVTRIDPVCGMTVASGTPHWLEDGSGTLRLFCSSLCLATFRANPQTYRSAPKPGETRGRDAGRYGPVLERRDDLSADSSTSLPSFSVRSPCPRNAELMTHVAACRSCQAALHELGTLPDPLALVPRSVGELINRSPNPFNSARH